MMVLKDEERPMVGIYSKNDGWMFAIPSEKVQEAVEEFKGNILLRLFPKEVEKILLKEIDVVFGFKEKEDVE